MPFAGTGFTPKWERGTCFLLVITMEFVQKESDKNQQKYEREEMCVNEIPRTWNRYKDHNNS